MKAMTLPISSAVYLPLILGLVIIGITYAAATGRSLPLIASPRAALIALLIIGMTACAMGGIGQVAASGKWASPVAMLGYLLGAAILVVFSAGLFGWKLPFVADDKAAVLAMAVLIGAKFVIGTISYFLRLL